jgi:hypothetical protein
MSFELIKDWTTQAGLRALVVKGSYRDSLCGTWYCGYVGIPKTHPLYGKSYHDEMPPGFSMSEDTPIGKRGVVSLFCGVNFDAPSLENYFNVHGSLTFDGPGVGCVKDSEDLWWLGFDCNHAYDTPVRNNDVYTARECEYLAKQLACVDAESRTWKFKIKMVVYAVKRFFWN